MKTFNRKHIVFYGKHLESYCISRFLKVGKWTWNSHAHQKCSPRMGVALCVPPLCPSLNSRPRKSPEVHQLLPFSWLSVFSSESIEQHPTAASDISVLWKPASTQDHLCRIIWLSSAASHHVCYTEWVIRGVWFEKERGPSIAEI